MIILTAGARMPLRGNCLCPGKYFHELHGVDRGEIPRAGLAAGEQQKRALSALQASGRGVGGGWGEEELGGQKREERAAQCPREAGAALESGYLMFSNCFLLF